jgi:5-methylcytosine-specific restriction endonuclease McrA
MEPDKRQRRIEREHEKLKALTIGSVFNKHPSGLACLFQRLVRLANADQNGFCECISCGVKQPWNTMDSGHFVSRNNKATILDPENCWPQCKSCNQWKSGNTAEYRKRLVEKIGSVSVERLEVARLPKNHVWNRLELAEVKVNLMDEIRLHETRLGIRK